MNLATIAALLGHQAPNTPLTGVSIDTRRLEPGSLFVALRGEQFDGHDFMAQALAKGAVAVICERLDVSLPAHQQLLVKDSHKALVAIAKAHRDTISCPIIALTGSNGKTTVKEMIASILPKPSVATKGNLNNHIGVPLSVLQLSPEHRYAVFELGANHQGEIAYTVGIVRPQVALITNVGPAHLAGFGSIEGVAEAKGEIYQGLQSDGTAVINADDAFARSWEKKLPTKHLLHFSLKKKSDVNARNIRFNDQDNATFTLILPDTTAEISLQVPGEHSVQNALAAAACAYALGISGQDIARGLNQFQGVAQRMTYRSGKNQSLVIDDTYNANLRSVLTALKVLAKRPGEKILVLGDLGELGAATREHHEEIGHAAREQGIDHLLTCGNHAKFTGLAYGKHAKHYGSQQALVQDLLPKLSKDTTVLVKGSRSAAMELVVQQLISA